MMINKNSVRRQVVTNDCVNSCRPLPFRFQHTHQETIKKIIIMFGRFSGSASVSAGDNRPSSAQQELSTSARSRLGNLFRRGPDLGGSDDDGVVVDNVDDDDDDDSGSYEEEIIEDDDDGEGEDDMESVDSNSLPPQPPPIIIEKPISTQVFVNPSSQPSPSVILSKAQSEITCLSIFLKDLVIQRDVATQFIKLIRGDNKSWEAIAVEILRQNKPRWDKITFESCRNNNNNTNNSNSTKTEGDNNIIETDTNNNNNNNNNTTTTATTTTTDSSHHYNNHFFLDVCISYVITIDNCSHLHLTDLILTKQLSQAFIGIGFSKSIQKLELDLLDLSSCIDLIGDAILHNTTITTLIATRCGLQDLNLKKLIESCPKQLIELRIFGNRCRSKGLEALSHLLCDPKKCQLEILDISFQHVDVTSDNDDNEDEDNNKFDIIGIATSLFSNTTLKSLDMDNDGLDDTAMTHIVSALEANSTLEELKLNHNHITNVGVSLMASRFCNFKGLKKISMYSNSFE